MFIYPRNLKPKKKVSLRGGTTKQSVKLLPIQNLKLIEYL
jgi:hypothetical protein